MALILSTEARNASVNAVVALVDGGAAAGALVVLDAGSNVLVSFDLSDPAFAAAAAGSASANGLPVASTGEAVAGAGTDAASFEVRDSDGTVVWSGTVTATGGGGDAEIDNVSIAQGQTVNLTGLSYSQGNP